MPEKDPIKQNSSAEKQKNYLKRILRIFGRDVSVYFYKDNALISETY